jgi:hypothetical protein
MVWLTSRSINTGSIQRHGPSTTHGIPDGRAIEYGFDPTIAGFESLAASSGNTVLQCYEADLNPTNAASRLAILSISATGIGVRSLPHA